MIVETLAILAIITLGSLIGTATEIYLRLIKMERKKAKKENFSILSESQSRIVEVPIRKRKKSIIYI